MNKIERRIKALEQAHTKQVEDESPYDLSACTVPELKFLRSVVEKEEAGQELTPGEEVKANDILERVRI